MVPALFGVSVSQINLLLDTVIASFLPVGSVSWLYYSDRLVAEMNAVERAHGGHRAAMFRAQIVESTDQKILCLDNHSATREDGCGRQVQPGPRR
jgi:hypothetical protein